METALSTPVSSYIVQCHGTSMNEISIHLDELRVLLVHETMNSDDGIIISFK